MKSLVKKLANTDIGILMNFEGLPWPPKVREHGHFMVSLSSPGAY